MSQAGYDGANGDNAIRRFGDRAHEIRRAELRTFGGEDKPTVIQKCCKGEHILGMVEIIRNELKKLEANGGNIGYAAHVLSRSVSTLAAMLRFMLSPAEQEQYSDDKKAYPESPVPHKNWCDRLRTACGTGAAQDVVSAAVRAIGDWLIKLGSKASNQFLQLLSVVASNPVARASVAALLVLFLATAYANAAGTASMGGASFVGGLATVATEIVATTAGYAVTTFGTAMGAIPTLLLSLGAAFVVSWVGGQVYKAACDARCRHFWWDGFLRSLGVRGGEPPRPSWVVPAALENNLNADARDIIDSYTLELLIEPTLLRGRVYERRFIEDWIRANGTDPWQSKELVSIRDLRPCPAMRALVVEFAEEHRLQVAMRVA